VDEETARGWARFRRGIPSLMLYTGCRVSDLVNLELEDLLLGERTGTVVFRFGKGNKQRSVPLSLPAFDFRRAPSRRCGGVRGIWRGSRACPGRR